MKKFRRWNTRYSASVILGIGMGVTGLGMLLALPALTQTTPTPLPTAAPLPTVTPLPTAAPLPTVTPLPTPGSTPVPQPGTPSSPVASPSPFATPAPLQTPLPTRTPGPTGTPPLTSPTPAPTPVAPLDPRNPTPRSPISPTPGGTSPGTLPSPSPTPGVPVTPQPTPGAPISPQSTRNVPLSQLLRQASRAGSFKTLAAAVEAAGLNNTLENRGGRYTIFAPTDAAFAALPSGTLEQLLAPQNRPLLIRLLAYHVVPQELTSSQLRTGGLSSLAGGLSLRVEGGRVIVNNGSVVQADIQGSNGVIHAVNRVLIPAGFFESAQPTAPTPSTQPTTP